MVLLATRQTVHNWVATDRMKLIVAAKSKGLCEICGHSIVWEAHYRSRYSPQLDHIIPREFWLGPGADHPDNLRYVHAICNRQRQTGPKPTLVDMAATSHLAEQLLDGEVVTIQWHPDDPARFSDFKLVAMHGHVTNVQQPWNLVPVSASMLALSTW